MRLPARAPIRLLRTLCFVLVSGVSLGLASGCARPQGGIVDTYDFDTPPYVMPSFYFMAP